MKKKSHEVQSINCEQAVVRLNNFMDNYLKGQRREELMKHLSECRSCMERFEFEQLLKTKVHLLASSDSPALRKKIEKLITSL